MEPTATRATQLAIDIEIKRKQKTTIHLTATLHSAQQWQVSEALNLLLGLLHF